MAKLVILTPGLPVTGRTHELNVDRTTIGRVEDNMFQIAEASVSSHHCEVHLRGSEVLIRDLNSTNGTFINGEKVTESPLKPGQTLRLGNVELKLEVEGAAAPTAGPAAAPAPPKRQVEATMVIPRGVSLSDLESGTGRAPSLDTSKEFSKKRNKAGLYFWLAFGIVILLIVGLLIYAILLVNGASSHK
ncbi:MAG TPA: FHA domain-containing protein [Candidatus Acidoferrum sp.]|nr:FHA domain-containing protein [Candidatus Acidoferrum sp.]